jgi:hypothetical protein
VDLVTADRDPEILGADVAERPRRLHEGIQRALGLAEGLDLPFTIAVNPTVQLGAYFKEYSEVLVALLGSGHITWRSPQPFSRCIEIAMLEYASWASGKPNAAFAIRSFLNYEQQQTQQNVILDNVRGLTVALEDWLRDNNLPERRREKWGAYRKTIVELPDDKSTMFNENFGGSQGLCSTNCYL